MENMKKTNISIFYNYSIKKSKFTKQIDLSNINYKIQFSNILNSKLKKSNIYNKDLSFSFQKNKKLEKITSLKKNKLNSTILEQSKINPQIYLLLNLFLIEKYFIFSQNISSKKTINVLSRVPNYKMNLSSSVSADRYKGNIYKRLSILNLDRLLNQKVPSYSTHLNSFAFLESFRKNSKLNNAKFLDFKKFSQNIITSKKTNNVAFYLKPKIYAIFIKSALKKKFYKKIKIILYQKRLMKKI